MCGRYALEPTDKFYNRFQIENRLDELTPRYNIAPTQSVPVVLAQSPNRVMLMRWGLIPHWAKDKKNGYSMINARLETLNEKPSYRKLLENKRCLVPASGFYEWQQTNGHKTPFFIHEKDAPLFAFAGLYDIWEDKNGKEVYSFTIVTTKSNENLSGIHQRMPVILPKESEAEWLDVDLADTESAMKVLEQSKQPHLDFYPVSSEINKPANDFAGLLKRIKQ